MRWRKQKTRCYQKSTPGHTPFLVEVSWTQIFITRGTLSASGLWVRGKAGEATHLCQLPCSLAWGSHSPSGQCAQTQDPQARSHPPGSSAGCPLSRDPQARVSPSWVVCGVSPEPRPPGPVSPSWIVCGVSPSSAQAWPLAQGGAATGLPALTRGRVSCALCLQTSRAS